MNKEAVFYASGSDEVTQRVFEILGANEFLVDSLFSDEAPTNENPTNENPTGESAEDPWILSIEDDRDFSLALQLRLKRHGLSVVRAFDGVSGVQTAMTTPAEAIILDYNLPNGRGDYVLRRLKANKLTRDIPVIVVSGQKTPGLEKMMRYLGAERFFSKPVRFEEIAEELQKHIPTRIV